MAPRKIRNHRRMFGEIGYCKTFISDVTYFRWGITHKIPNLCRLMKRCKSLVMILIMETIEFNALLERMQIDDDV